MRGELRQAEGQGQETEFFGELEDGWPSLIIRAARTQALTLITSVTAVKPAWRKDTF